MTSVNQVLGEYAAGRTDDGSIDMIWINGNSFKTLRQADLLFGPYAQYLPNAKYIDADHPGWDFDFGYPVQGYESHWGQGKFTLAYDSARVTDPPSTVQELLTWICDHPGRFTYPQLPTFTGRRFVTEVFYGVTGGYEQWQGIWDADKQALWDEKSPLLWDALQTIEPCLWRGGDTYPADVAPLDDLYANGEIDWTMATGAYRASSRALEGLFPATTQTMVFTDGTVSDTHYVGIMANSPNQAAAMVLANMLQDPEAQLLFGDPNVRGDLIAINPELTDFPELFAEIDYGPGALTPAELAPHLPIPPVETVPLFEEGWRIFILEN
jgi:putative spermidine/putrescine transport system substrate-binding protein